MFKKSFEIPVGFSDHSTGIASAIIAVTMGSKIIEKHITLDRSMGKNVMMVSIEGGVDIEKVAKEAPEKIHKI